MSIHINPFVQAVLVVVACTHFAAAQPLRHFWLRGTAPFAEAGIRYRKATDFTTHKITNINLKVQRSFFKHFPPTDQDAWYAEGKNFCVRLQDGTTKTTVMFSQRGAVVYSIQHNISNTIPGNVYEEVTFLYPGYKVLSAAHVVQSNHDFWHLTMKQDKKFVVLRVEGNDVQTEKKFEEP